MATSGTFAFTLDLADAMEEAYERCGLELRSGYDYRTARRSLNMLMLEWQNRGLNLWSVKNTSHRFQYGVTRSFHCLSLASCFRVRALIIAIGLRDS